MRCRLCLSPDLTSVVDLGVLAFTGIFPEDPSTEVPKGRLEVVLCPSCGLAQLDRDFPADVMYGSGYGYRSGLNAGMVRHLSATASRLDQLLPVDGGVVLDIGSNDGTLLGFFQDLGADCIGVDPTSSNWTEFIPPGVTVIDGFFRAVDIPVRARLVTSIAMFYDLPDRIAFARDVHTVLEPDGLWHLEVAYAPAMLRSGAFDTICHEHTEYYSLTSLLNILDVAGFCIVNASTNATNGGSIAVTAAKKSSRWAPDMTIVPWLLAMESRADVGDPSTWRRFAHRVRQQRDDLLGLLSALKVRDGAVIKGLGASTKGNVLLQTTGIGPMLVDAIGDVNPDKWGRVTPGTHIPIVPEEDVLDADYLLVLPWHFREGFMTRMDGYLAGGGKLIFPLPDIEIVGY